MDPLKQKTEEIIIDSTSNFWDDLRERINAPFFVSFLISWCLINWKILLLLFWYSDEFIYASRNVDRIEAIKNELYWLNIWFWPLFATTLYILLYPHLKEYLRVYNAEIKLKGNQAINKVTNDDSFQIRNYIKLKNLYNEERKKLEEQRLDEASYLKEKEAFEVQKKDISEELKTKDARILYLTLKATELEEMTHLDHYTGTFELKIASMDRISFVETFFILKITNTHFILVDTSNNIEQSFKISGYSYDPYKFELMIYSDKKDSSNHNPIDFIHLQKGGSAYYGKLYIIPEHFSFDVNVTYWLIPNKTL